MIGAITGDIIGSVFERRNVKTTDFELFRINSRFTDDSVLSIAAADAILNDCSFTDAVKQWGLKYPNAGYGGNFYRWLHSNSTEPYNSWGNGSAMQVSPVGFAYDNLEKVLQKAEESAAITHNPLEGIKGAQAIATSFFLARTGSSKQHIWQDITERFNYALQKSLDETHPGYTINVRYKGSVSEAIIAFL